MMNKKNMMLILQVAIWTLLFMSPMMYMNHGQGINLRIFLMFNIPQMVMMIVFYANYLYLAPRYIVSGKAHTCFWIANIMMILLFGIGTHYCVDFFRNILIEAGDMPRPRHIYAKDGHKPWVLGLFILRNMFNIAISAAIATAIVLTDRWQTAENARKEAESARIQAELGSLRAQINPHFLLNTLNNIYALISFDAGHAQQAVEQLSKMLRYMLYDNEEESVNLEKEVELLKNYIALMKLRMSGNTEVTFETKIPNPCHIRIAPLIFISLVENAFKHGISSTEPSFVKLALTADKKQIVFCVENSYYPKNDSDRSGHGIGLQQVAKRLELTYNGRYEWHREVSEDKKKYSSKIIIYDS